MKTKGLKIINKKKPNNNILYLPYEIQTLQPVVGNFNDIDFKKYQVTVPRNFYMTFEEHWKKENRRKHYKNKIKSI